MLGTVSRAAIPILWIAWLIYWMVAARDVKTTRWKEPVSERWLHGVPFILAAALLIPPAPSWGFLIERFLPNTTFLDIAGTSIVALGLGFAVWARRHLGRDWSGTITLKDDHRLVRTGPYHYVRHPIYTGMLAGFIGTAIAVGQWRSLIATFFFLIGVLVRCRVEETKMRETFPEYEEYRRRSWAIFPFLY